MKWLKIIILCRYYQFRSFEKCLFGIINVLSWTILLLITGVLSGILTNNGYFAISAIEHLSTGLALTVCLLNEKEYKYLMPLYPAIPRTIAALYKVADNIISPENLIIALILLPCYLISDVSEISGTLYTILSMLSVNTILRLSATTVSVLSSRIGFIRPVLLVASIAYCTATLFLNMDNFKFSLYHMANTCVSAILICILIFSSIAGYRIFKRNNIYVSLKYRQKTHAGLRKSSSLFKNMLVIVVRQNFKCPAYKTIYASLFSIAIFGIFLFGNEGSEYVGASLLIGMYTLSFLQYSTSFLSLSPEAFCSSPIPYRFYVYPFLAINMTVTTVMTVCVSLYMESVIYKPALPLAAIWAIVNGPISQIILLSSLFPVKFDLWSGNFHANRSPVRWVISGISAFLLFVTAAFIQAKTAVAGLVLGILSFISIIFYNKYIVFIEYSLYKRRHNMIKKLKQ